MAEVAKIGAGVAGGVALGAGATWALPDLQGLIDALATDLGSGGIVSFLAGVTFAAMFFRERAAVERIGIRSTEAAAKTAEQLLAMKNATTPIGMAMAEMADHVAALKHALATANELDADRVRELSELRKTVNRLAQQGRAP